MPTTNSPSRLGAAARALGAALVLLVLLVAVPVALARYGVLPHSVPTWRQAADALTSPDTGRLFVGAVTGAGWIAWIGFTLSVLVEIAAAARHRAAPRLPALGAAQHLAASLVTSVLLVLPTAGLAAAATPGPSPAAVAHLHHTPQATAPSDGEGAIASGQTATPASAASGGPVYRVQRHDTLWGIARDRLGDPLRWRELADLNAHLLGGRSAADGAHHLQPGWELHLPADARTAPDAAPGGGGERLHTVRPGETLTSIAEHELGRASAVGDLARLNLGRAEPGGAHLDNPDLIYPDWTIALPAAAPPAAPPAGSPAAHAGTGSGGSRDQVLPGTDAPRPHTSDRQTGRPVQADPGGGPATTVPHTADPRIAPRPAPHSPAPAEAPTVPAPQSSQPAPHRPVTAPPRLASVPAASPERAEPTGHSTGELSPARVAEGVGALLAACLLAALGIKRALQQRSRRPGETIAMPASTAPLEHALVHHAAPASVELLHAALRTLAAHCATTATPLPDVTGALIAADGIRLLADGAPVHPFRTDSDGRWSLDPAAELVGEDDPDAPPAPYPGLVTLGTTETGTLVLANLHHLGTVLLNGTASHIRETTRALALEAATCPWAPGTEVLVVSADPQLAELPGLLPSGRLRHLHHLRDACTDLAELLLVAHQEEQDAPNGRSALPWLLIVADAADPDAAWQLADLVNRLPHGRVALVLPGDGLAALYPHAEHLDADQASPQPLAAAGVDVALQRLPDDAMAQLLESLHTTEEPAQPPRGPWADVPEGPEQLETPDPHQPLAPETKQQASAPYAAFLRPAATPGDAAPAADPGAGPADPAVPAPTEPVPAPVPVPRTTARTAPTSGPGAAPKTAEDEGTAEPQPLHAPEISVLGPLTVTGLTSSGRGRRLAEVAAYLYLNPGRKTSAIAEAMNPISPWQDRTVIERTYQLRRMLGTAPDGEPYLPRGVRGQPYPRFHPALRCDWTRFQRLAERGLSRGPSGVADLEAALGLVRGRPFQDSEASWAVPLVQEMIARILDTAHTVACHRIATGQWDAARRAITIALGVEPSAELLYQDWIKLEHRIGSRAGIQRAVAQLQEALRALDVEMEPATEQLLADVYGAAAARAEGF